MVLSHDAARRARRLALENAVAHGGEARAGPIVSRLLADDPTLRPAARAATADVEEIVREISALSADAQRSALAALGGPEPASPDAEAKPTLPALAGATPGAVVLRLAPFPSGALHIGNARMLYVNDYYRTLYRGKLLLVFDDTVGSEEKRVDPEMFGQIAADLATADVPVDATYYKSDRLPRFYEWARRVIDRGGAYVCHCPPELLRENRALGRACAERAEPITTTIDGWEKMLGGTYATGEAVLRLRTDLADPDPAFRDRVLFRLSDLDHPRVGRKYRVWPMLEFSWAVDDVELGVTHVLRGKDLVIEDRMESFLWKLLDVRGPAFVHWGILRVSEAKLSKSKSSLEVKSGVFDGWADPRSWSIASLDRRGITVDALRRFTLSFGLSLSDIEVPAETLYAENRAVIDATTPRRSFVEDPVRVHVEGFPDELASVDLANHPDDPAMGRRTVSTGPEFWLARSDVVPRLGSEVRLKDLANIELPAALPTAPEALRARFTSRENRKLPRLQWVGARDAVAVDLLGLDGHHRLGVGEAAVATAAPGARLQFERVGFVRIEKDRRADDAAVRVCFGHP